MSEKKPDADLFHILTDSDSAEIRRYLVANELTHKVNFRNVNYESHAEALKGAIGCLEVPTLIQGTTIVRGKNAILEWIKKD